MNNQSNTLTYEINKINISSIFNILYTKTASLYVKKKKYFQQITFSKDQSNLHNVKTNWI